MLQKLLLCSSILLLMVAATIPVLAQQENLFPGTVRSINTLRDNFIFETAAGDVFTVLPPSGFSMGSLGIGKALIISGVQDGSTIIASQIADGYRRTGRVQSKDAADGTFFLQVSQSEIYKVRPPDGFNLNRLNQYDVLTVSGVLNDETLAAYSISFLAEYTSQFGNVVSIDKQTDSILVRGATGEIEVVQLPAGYVTSQLRYGDPVVVFGSNRNNRIEAARILHYTQFTGKVSAISIPDRMFQFRLWDGTIYSVEFPAGSSMRTPELGDVLMVNGWQENRLIIATDLRKLSLAEIPNSKAGFFCSQLSPASAMTNPYCYVPSPTGFSPVVTQSNPTALPTQVQTPQVTPDPTRSPDATQPPGRDNDKDKGKDNDNKPGNGNDKKDNKPGKGK